MDYPDNKIYILNIMLLLELPEDIIYHILSFAKYDNEPHVIYIKNKNKNNYCKLFYKGEWENHTFEGYGRMYCKDADKCNVPLEEPFNINVLNTFYKHLT